MEKGIKTMNINLCTSVLLVGSAMVGGGIYEYGPFAPVHGAQPQQNDITE